MELFNKLKLFFKRESSLLKEIKEEQLKLEEMQENFRQESYLKLLEIEDSRRELKWKMLALEQKELELKKSQTAIQISRSDNDKIENLVAQYALGILGIIESGSFDYERFKKTGLRINECITRLNSLALNYSKTGIIDQTIKHAIEAWSKKESTPESYKGVFQ